MLPISYYIKQPRELLITLLHHFGRRIPDKLYLKWLFRLKTGKRLNLSSPKSFSEKLQWLKLYDRKPIYTTMVDKYAVKEFVANIIGEKYIIPTLGVWNKPENIEWEKLPSQFVLKTTHSGGSTGVVICNDKGILDKEAAVNKLSASMGKNVYNTSREWPYKNVKPRIIAEEFIQPDDSKEGLSDYKWYCFGGQPMYCQVIQNRYSHETIDFFDVDWNHQEFVGLNPTAGNAAITPARPLQLEKQIDIAKRLSQGLHFSRIDLYEANGHVYFGEITFYPMSGFGKFRPMEYNEILGQMLGLN